MFPISDPILVFTTLLLVMLAAPLLAERLRVPDLILLLLAGAALGPNGLGILARHPAITMFGSVGMLYIMFLAGLEIDLYRFRRTKRRSLAFGLITFAIPQGVGTLVVRYALGFDWTASILIASMFASHTLLAYPLAGRLGISRDEPVAVTVGATILTDTLALLVLAVIADAARGESLGPAFWTGMAAGMAALVALTWWGIPRLTRWFFDNVTEAGGAQFLFVIVTVCACSYLSHYARMEPIIGAFLAGAAFNRLIPERSVLMNRVAFVGNTLFIPFFLVSVGMLVDPGAMVREPRSLFVGAMMVGTVVATKYMAAWVAAMLFGYDRDSRQVMFGLSVVQAAATLAAVLVGYELKIFGASVLNGAMGMIIVTCPLGAWMVDRHGRRIAARGKVLDRSAARVEQRLLVPVANPVSSTHLLDLAFLLRDPAVPGGIHPVTIVRDAPDTDEAVARGEELLAHCLSRAASADIPVSPSVRVGFNVSDGILRAAKELRATVVMAGWEGEPSVRARIFGGVTRNLLDACPSRLYFCRLVRPLNTTRRLLLPFPPLAERRQDLPALLRDARFLSRQTGTDLRVYLTGPATAELRKAVEAAKPSGPLTVVETPSPAEARAVLLSEIGGDDILMLPGERRLGALWNPTIDPWPDVLATRFPENDILVVYPPMGADEEFPPGESDAPSAGRFEVYPAELAAGVGIEESARRLASVAFADRPGLAAEARRRLLASATTYPVEIAAGVVLLHAHCEGLERPTLIVGRSAGGWTFPGLGIHAGVLLGMLSPKGQPPDLHLKSLAELARCFHNPAFAAAVADATSASGIGGLIRETLENGKRIEPPRKERGSAVGGA